MAWTTPRTWIAGELVTASIGNTHWRDNLQSLYDTSAQLRGQGAVLGKISPTALAAGTTNNYNPTGLTTLNWLRLSNNEGGGVSLGGIVAQPDGTWIFLANVGSSSGTLTLLNEDGGSTAANRFKGPGGGNPNISNGGFRLIVYDGTLARWTINQGTVP